MADDITFVTDNIPDPDGAGDFIASAEHFISTYVTEPFRPLRLYENNFDTIDGLTAAITDPFQVTGTLFLNYIGHGRINEWTKEQIWTVGDVVGLNNATQLPVLLSMDCLDGYWIYPNQQSLAEEMTRHRRRDRSRLFAHRSWGGRWP